MHYAVHDYGEDLTDPTTGRRTVYLVMELVRGEPLAVGVVHQFPQSREVGVVVSDHGGEGRRPGAPDLDFHVRELALPPGDYRVRVLVRNTETGRMGLTVEPLRVPDFSGKHPYLAAPVFLEKAEGGVFIRGRPGPGSTPGSCSPPSRPSCRTPRRRRAVSSSAAPGNLLARRPAGPGGTWPAPPGSARLG